METTVFHRCLGGQLACVYVEYLARLGWGCSSRVEPDLRMPGGASGQLRQPRWISARKKQPLSNSEPSEMGSVTGRRLAHQPHNNLCERHNQQYNPWLNTRPIDNGSVFGPAGTVFSFATGPFRRALIGKSFRFRGPQHVQPESISKLAQTAMSFLLTALPASTSSREDHIPPKVKRGGDQHEDESS